MAAQCSCTLNSGSVTYRLMVSARRAIRPGSRSSSTKTIVSAPASSYRLTASRALHAYFAEPDLDLFPHPPPVRELIDSRGELYEATYLDRRGVPGIGVTSGHREHPLARSPDDDRRWLDRDRTDRRVVHTQDGFGDGGSPPQDGERAAARLRVESPARRTEGTARRPPDDRGGPGATSRCRGRSRAGRRSRPERRRADLPAGGPGQELPRPHSRMRGPRSREGAGRNHKRFRRCNPSLPRTHHWDLATTSREEDATSPGRFPSITTYGCSRTIIQVIGQALRGWGGRG